MNSEFYYKDGYTYVVVYDRISKLERKFKGNLLDLWGERKLQMARAEMIDELKFGKRKEK